MDQLLSNSSNQDYFFAILKFHLFPVYDIWKKAEITRIENDFERIVKFIFFSLAASLLFCEL